MSRIIPSILVLGLVVITSTRALAVPDVLTYAGSLRRGDVDANGTFAVELALFDSATAAAPVFTQSEPSLAVTAGELIVDLGADPANPLSDEVLASDALFLAITVDGEELAPRIPLTSVPFALQSRFAEDSDSVGGLTADDIAALAAHEAGAGLSKSGNTFSLATNGVTSAHILDGSIIGADIAASAVTSTHIANGAVTGVHLAPGAVTSATLADDAVTSAALVTDAVTAAELADNAVGSAEVANDSLTALDLANNAVTSAEILDGAVTSLDILDGAISSLDILDNSIGANDIGVDAVGVTEIAANAVGSSELVDNSVTGADIAPETITGGDIQTAAVGNSELAANAVTSSKIAEGSIDAAHLQNSGIRVFREANQCGGSLTLTLDDDCVASACQGQINLPTPAGCTCQGGSSQTQGIAVCPNIEIGRLVRN